MLEIGSIVWGVKDVKQAVSFWSSALNYKLKAPASEGWAMLVPSSGSGVQLSLNLISSPKARRHHLDLYTSNRDAAAKRLLALGASETAWIYPEGADYHVLRDPDGNAFCVVEDTALAKNATEIPYIGAVVWGVKHTARTAAFWMAALNYSTDGISPDGWAMLTPKEGSPETGKIHLLLKPVSSPKARRHHIDLFTLDQPAEVERLIALGATRKQWNYPDDADYVVLQDPDGNPFCVVQR